MTSFSGRQIQDSKIDIFESSLFLLLYTFKIGIRRCLKKSNAISRQTTAKEVRRSGENLIGQTNGFEQSKLGHHSSRHTSSGYLPGYLFQQLLQRRHRRTAKINKQIQVKRIISYTWIQNTQIKYLMGLTIDCRMKRDKYAQMIINKTRYLLFILYKFSKVLQAKSLLIDLWFNLLCMGRCLWQYTNSLQSLLDSLWQLNRFFFS